MYFRHHSTGHLSLKKELEKSNEPHGDHEHDPNPGCVQGEQEPDKTLHFQIHLEESDRKESYLQRS